VPDQASISNDSSEKDRLIDRGRRRIFLHGLIFGVPFLVLLTVAGLQYSGALRLGGYFTFERPETVDPMVIYLALAVTAWLLVFVGGSGVLQGFVSIYRERKL
jgi:hypothetical protein